MSQKTNSEIGNLQLEYSALKAMEKKLNDIAQIDTTTVSEIRALTMEIKHKTGKFDEHFQAFLQEEGIQNNFHLLDIVAHFWNLSKKTLVVAG